MDEWLARFLMVVEAVGLVCLTGLTAYWMKLRHDRKMLGSGTDVAQLRDELDELRATTQAELQGLHERIDFADRLLTQNRTALPESETPTPV